MGSPSRKRTLTTSIVLHTLLIGIPLLLSIWFTNTLDIQNYTRTLLVAPPAPSAPAPPPSVAAGQPARQTRRVFTSGGKLFMPPAIPKQIAMVKEEPLAPEPAGGVFGGVPGGATGGVIGGILEGIKAPEAPAPPRPAVESSKAPIPVGGNVQPPRVINRVAPEYPILAHQAGIQGEVIISAVIDTKGNVVNMKVVSGPALLYEAAMKALAQWKFEPTYLNGEPVAIRWNATVNFRILTMNRAS
jgi:protein TonB